ncbi:hypothetical protein CFP56_017480 [Quercus suber]|uniref:Uncharacterized protein n=1 Tax=Quercus suber TaxID=58331 RepID=A0AAW0KMK8_QUESU
MKCTPQQENMGTYISKQTSYSKTQGNRHVFRERIFQILGSSRKIMIIH